MKKLFLLGVFFLMSQVNYAQDEAMKKDLMRIFEMSATSQQIKMGREQILKMVPAEKQAAFIVEFDSTLPALYDKMIKIIYESYTKEDVKALLAFYDSPIGKKLTAKSNEITEKSQVAATEWGQGLQTMMMKYMQ